MQEQEAGLADRGYLGEIRMAGRMQRHMDNNWILCELVEVGNGRKEDRGRRRNRDEFAGLQRLERGKQRVDIVLKPLYLYWTLSAPNFNDLRGRIPLAGLSRRHCGPFFPRADADTLKRRNVHSSWAEQRE